MLRGVIVGLSGIGVSTVLGNVFKQFTPANASKFNQVFSFIGEAAFMVVIGREMTRKVGEVVDEVTEDANKRKQKAIEKERHKLMKNKDNTKEDSKEAEE